MAVTTISTLTLWLAQAIGLYLILLGLAGVVNPRRWQAAIEEVRASAALQLIGGVLAFALGATIAVLHSLLTDPLAIAVTLFGWAALLKGALLIAVPGPLMRLATASLGHVRIWSIVLLILGLLIGISGLLGHADATHIVSTKGLIHG